MAIGNFWPHIDGSSVRYHGHSCARSCGRGALPVTPNRPTEGQPQGCAVQLSLMSNVD